jgi:hypothetical protein
MLRQPAFHGVWEYLHSPFLLIFAWKCYLMLFLELYVCFNVYTGIIQNDSS